MTSILKYDSKLVPFQMRAAFGLVYMHEEQPEVCINCIFYAILFFLPGY